MEKTGTFVVHRTGQAPLRFRGREIVSVASSPDRAHPDYSGRVGRYARLRIYRTAKGRYVAAISRYSLHQGEHDCHEAAVYPTLRESVEWMARNATSPEVDWLIDSLPPAEVAEEVE